MMKSSISLTLGGTGHSGQRMTMGWEGWNALSRDNTNLGSLALVTCGMDAACRKRVAKNALPYKVCLSVGFM